MRFDASVSVRVIEVSPPAGAQGDVFASHRSLRLAQQRTSYEVREYCCPTLRSVGNQVQRETLLGLAIGLAQDLQPLDVRMALPALADDLSIEHVQCREQRGGAVMLPARPRDIGTSGWARSSAWI